MSLPVGSQFTPTQDFSVESLKSVYCKGLTYTVREGNDLLAQLAEQWLQQGLVKMGAAPAEAGTAEGEGETL